MSENQASGSERVPPLNLTQDEVDYLWDLITDEIGKQAVWESGDIDTVNSLHSKIGRIGCKFDTGSQQEGRDGL